MQELTRDAHCNGGALSAKPRQYIWYVFPRFDHQMPQASSSCFLILKTTRIEMKKDGKIWYFPDKSSSNVTEPQDFYWSEKCWGDIDILEGSATCQMKKQLNSLSLRNSWELHVSLSSSRGGICGWCFWWLILMEGWCKLDHQPSESCLGEAWNDIELFHIYLWDVWCISQGRTRSNLHIYYKNESALRVYFCKAHQK